MRLGRLVVLMAAVALAGCGSEPARQTATQAETTAEPAVAREAQAVASDFVAEVAAEGVRLDYSPESLQALERYISKQWTDPRRRHSGVVAKRYRDRYLDIGAYFGEVVRRNLTGEWEMHPDFGPAVRLGKQDHAFVFATAQQRLENGYEDDIAATYNVLARSHDTRPAVVVHLPLTGPFRGDWVVEELDGFVKRVERTVKPHGGEIDSYSSGSDEATIEVRAGNPDLVLTALRALFARITLPRGVFAVKRTGDSGHEERVGLRGLGN